MTDINTDIEFSADDLGHLKVAKSKLEYPSLIGRLTEFLGKPIETGFKLMPKDWNNKIGEVVQSALLKGLEFAVFTMGKPDAKESQDWLHKILVAGSGAAGGALGLASLPVELPISTCIMLRSIADIARSEGHDISLLEIKFSCLEVLALGGGSSKDDSAENGYWVMRSILAKSVSDAIKYVTERGLIEETAPPIIRLITTIATRFGIIVTEEIAAKAIPVVGAVSGGTINLLFTHHFQEIARGHFIVKRLEKKYGSERVKAIYDELII